MGLFGRRVEREQLGFVCIHWSRQEMVTAWVWILAVELEMG